MLPGAMVMSAELAKIKERILGSRSPQKKHFQHNLGSEAEESPRLVNSGPGRIYKTEPPDMAPYLIVL